MVARCRLALGLGAVILPLLWSGCASGHLGSNESHARGAVAAVRSAQNAYASVNQDYYAGRFVCLIRPSDCLPGFTDKRASFLAPEYAELGIPSGRQYERIFFAGDPPEIVVEGISPSSVKAYAFVVVPGPHLQERGVA